MIFKGHSNQARRTDTARIRRGSGDKCSISNEVGASGMPLLYIASDGRIGGAGCWGVLLHLRCSRANGSISQRDFIWRSWLQPKQAQTAPIYKLSNTKLDEGIITALMQAFSHG